MAKEGGCEVVDVHLRAQEFNWCIDEELRMCTSCVRPDDIRGVAIVPSSHFGYDANVFFGFGDIGADGVEALLCTTLGGGLRECQNFV